MLHSTGTRGLDTPETSRMVHIDLFLWSKNNNIGSLLIESSPKLAYTMHATFSYCDVKGISGRLSPSKQRKAIQNGHECARGLMSFKPWEVPRGAGEAEQNECQRQVAPCSKKPASTKRTILIWMSWADLIFARRLIDTVLRNNLWQFKKVRIGS